MDQLGLSRVVDLQRITETLVFEYERRRKNRRNQLSKVDGFAFEQMSEGKLERLRELGRILTQTPTITGSAILSAICDDDALALLSHYSATAYWFWRLVSLACNNANQLPLSRNDVYYAVKKARQEFHASNNLTLGNVLSSPLSHFKPNDITRLAQHGVIFPVDFDGNGDFSVPRLWWRNPIFQEPVLELLHRKRLNTARPDAT